MNQRARTVSYLRALSAIASGVAQEVEDGASLGEVAELLVVAVNRFPIEREFKRKLRLFLLGAAVLEDAR